MKKVLLVASVQSHICQFHKPLVKMLHENECEVHVAAHDNLNLKPGLKLDFVDKVYEVPFVRNPFKKENIAVYKKIKKIIEEGNYDVIHCNTPIASVLTRMAARKSRKKGTKVVYTAHGFHFYKGSSIKNWIIYYPVELLMSLITDLIITINKEDFKRAKGFRTAKVAYIPGVGVDTLKFRNAEKKDIHKEYSIPEDAFVILSVGELFPRKNHRVMLEVMNELKEYPIYYVICGNGILENELRNMCFEYGISSKVIFAGYRRDIPQLMKDCNLFAFPSIREGLGLAGIEAMAAGLPVVSSNMNGILDYMENGKTGYVCSPYNVQEFRESILKLYNDRQLCEEIKKYNIIKAQEFDVKESVKAIQDAYKQIT